MASQFSCVINCMDGRVQSAVINYIVNKYGTPYVDVVTAAGPAKILAEHKKHRVIRNVKFRTSVSVTSHEAKHLLIAGHFDCALIDTSDEKQKEYILKAVEYVKRWHLDVEVHGIFVHDDLTIEEL